MESGMMMMIVRRTVAHPDLHITLVVRVLVVRARRVARPCKDIKVLGRRHGLEHTRPLVVLVALDVQPPKLVAQVRVLAVACRRRRSRSGPGAGSLLGRFRRGPSWQRPQRGSLQTLIIGAKQ